VLILVRHGQTDANRDGLLLGRADPPLTATGRAQARAVADALRESADVTVVVSSPLARARYTAAAFGVPVEVDERWTELDYGDHDRKPLADIPVAVWERWRGDVEWAPVGGESLAACGKRVRAACEDLMARDVDGDIVAVSHVSPIKAAVAWSLGVGDEVAWRMFCDLASITRIGRSARGPVLLSYNEVGHLRAV
jgi:broad specificity phosphatase PhoE